MQHVVCHMDKAKKGSSGGLSNHIDRRNDQDREEHIYPERTNQNFELVERKGSIDQMINDRLEEGYKGKKAIRRDAVTSCRFILSGSHEQMTKIGQNPKAIREWAEDNRKYFAKMYGEENIIRATVHMDEKTPHMHLVVVPLTPDGKLSAKEFTGTKTKLRALQTNYAKEVGAKWGMERGVENSGKKHIESKAFYKYLDANEVDAQWMLDHPNAKELIATLIAENNKIKAVERKKIQEKSNIKKNTHNVGIHKERKQVRPNPIPRRKGFDKSDDFDIGR